MKFLKRIIKGKKGQLLTEDDYKRNVLNEHSKFAVVEAYNSTRTNMIYAMSGISGCKKIIFTSAMPAAGKTTTSVNIAVTFALTGEKVLLIDADLRKPKIHKALGLSNKIGLSSYLGGFCEREDVIFRDQTHGFDCVPAGHIPPNPSELLSSPKMAVFLNEVAEMYDYIFLDLPPVNVVTDAISLSKLATGVIIVARENHTDHESLKRAIASLKFAKAKILGFVLNGAGTRSGAYSRAYKNKKNYKYKYQYKYE